MSAQAIAAGVNAVGSLIQGVGAWRGSQIRSEQLKRAAGLARREASLDAQLSADDAERAAAQAVVQGAASGGGTGGSFGAVLESLERIGMFNVRSAIHAGQVEASNRLHEAAVARQEGRIALVSSMFNAGSSIASSRMREAETKKRVRIGKSAYAKGYGR